MGRRRISELEIREAGTGGLNLGWGYVMYSLLLAAETNDTMVVT